MTWTIIISEYAEKQLNKIPQVIGDRIALKLKDVQEEPFTYISRMVNSPNYKLRVGAYRVIMQVINDKLIVHFVEIVKRGRAYD